jgi:dihydrofolate reductase
MTTGHVYIATSLDGFVAGKDHDLEWLMKFPTEGEDHGFDEFMASVDGLVMGRGSFHTVLGFGGDWPYPKPVVVMSKTMSDEDIPEGLRDKVRLTRLEPAELMAELDEEGWSRAYIDGGKVVQSFIRAGLIEDFHLTLAPVLLGEGHRLFGETEGKVELEHLGSKSFPSGLLEARYRVVKNES